MQHILVIDNSATNLQEIEKGLSAIYTLIFTSSGDEAIDYLEHIKPDLILLNPKVKTSSDQFVHEVICDGKNNKGQLVIFLLEEHAELAGLTDYLALEYTDYLQKPFWADVLRLRVDKLMMYKKMQRDKYEIERKANRELEYITLQSFIAVANIIDIKVSQFHSRRTAYYATRIALKLGWNEESVMKLYYTALLHDIGMVGVSDNILSHFGELSDEEHDQLKNHVEIGATLLADIMMLDDAGNIIRCHHERYDGQGYPAGLKGEEIPLAARIIALADAYDAMTSERNYRTIFGKDKIKAELKKESGAQFDPNLVDILLDLIEAGLVYMDSWGSFEEKNSLNLAQEGNMLLQKIVVDYTEEVKNVAHRDALTGLWNRSYTENHINNFLRDEENTGALFMIDLDNFKSINDKFGHQEGDQILVDFAKLVQQCVRKDDLVCRLGGDEFMIFLKNIEDRQKIKERADIILQKFQQYLNGVEGFGVLSLSMGIAVVPTDGRDFATLYRQADKALYSVKQNGKHCYRFITEDVSGSALQERRARPVDLIHLKEILEEKTPISGVYEVSYEDFKRIYQLLQRILLRSRRSMQMLLFTLSSKQGENIPEEKMQIALNDLGKVIANSLRCGDIATNYSKNQYLVILMDASLEDGYKVGDRIIEKYDKVATLSSASLQFDLTEVEKCQQICLKN